MRSGLTLPCILLCFTVAQAGCTETDNDGHDPRDGETDGTDAADSGQDRSSDVESLGTDPPETAYEGFEEQYILTADDDPEDVCRVRYELHAVAEPAVPCAICEWDVVVEKRNPQIVTNRHGACENSELGLDWASIAARDGERVAYGFAPESIGHANILMQYRPESDRWEELTVSNWDALASRFRYKRRDGMCDYAGEGETTPSTPGICGISGDAIVTPSASADAE